MSSFEPQVPPTQEDAELLPQLLNIQNFLRANDPKKVMKERDSFRGWIKFIMAAIAIYFFISPLLPILGSFGNLAWLLAIMWTPVGIIAFGYFEYYARAEVWHICISRGIILDLDKTEWFRSVLFMFDLFLILLVCGLVGAMDNESDQGKRAWRAISMLFAMAFTIRVVQQIVDLEGANRMHTLNTFISLTNPHLLEHHGYKLVHYTQIAVWSAQKSIKGSAGEGAFSWNDIYRLPFVASPEFPKLQLLNQSLWGMRTLVNVRRYENLNC